MSNLMKRDHHLLKVFCKSHTRGGSWQSGQGLGAWARGTLTEGEKVPARLNLPTMRCPPAEKSLVSTRVGYNWTGQLKRSGGAGQSGLPLEGRGGSDAERRSARGVLEPDCSLHAKTLPNKSLVLGKWQKFGTFMEGG